MLGALRGLYRREYREVRAVDRISFTIEPGEMVAFLGPNGAGKTTTLKMLSGLIYPTSGEARVLGFVPWQRADAFRRQFALVMGQKNQLWWDLPAADSFQLHREIYSIPPAEFQQTLGELTELLGVEKLTRQAVRELSLGERMKMELIAALLAPAAAAPARRADDRPGRRGPGDDPEVPARLPHAARGDDAPDQPLHARRRGALRPRAGDHARHAGLRRPAGRDRRAVQRDEAGASSSSRRSAPEDLERFGEVVRREGPSADIKVERAAGRRGPGGDPRPPRRGRRERGGPAAGAGDRPGLRGGPHRPMTPPDALATAARPACSAPDAGRPRPAIARRRAGRSRRWPQVLARSSASRSSSG